MHLDRDADASPVANLRRRQIWAGFASFHTFTAIANVTDISLPEHERATHDATAHDSPNKYREWVFGLIDSGEASLTVHYDPAVHTTLLDDLEDDEPRNWQIAWPASAGGGRLDFKGGITGFSGSAPADGLLGAEITIKATGKVTPVAGP